MRPPQPHQAWSWVLAPGVQNLYSRCAADGSQRGKPKEQTLRLAAAAPQADLAVRQRLHGERPRAPTALRGICIWRRSLPRSQPERQPLRRRRTRRRGDGRADARREAGTCGALSSSQGLLGARQAACRARVRDRAETAARWRRANREAQGSPSGSSSALIGSSSAGPMPACGAGCSMCMQPAAQQLCLQAVRRAESAAAEWAGAAARVTLLLPAVPRAVSACCRWAGAGHGISGAADAAQRQHRPLRLRPNEASASMGTRAVACQGPTGAQICAGGVPLPLHTTVLLRHARVGACATLRARRAHASPPWTLACLLRGCAR
jgi:hypothetical protein